MCQHSPSVQMFDIPADALPERSIEEGDSDVRMSQVDIDNMIEKNNEFYDDENDNDIGPNQ